MKERAFVLREFDFLHVLIRNRVPAFSSWKAYNASEINDKNRQALFSKTESFVVPVYEKYAYLSFNLKSNNFSTTHKELGYILYILYTLKLYSSFITKVVIFNFKQKR